MSDATTKAALDEFYQQYLIEQEAASFIKLVSRKYTVGTLQRLADHPRRETRRAAVLALGFVGGYESNTVLGLALLDLDRGVRIAAENGIRSLWRRDGAVEHQQKLTVIMRLNSSQQFDAAARKATELIDEAPWFAEAWNQRAISRYSQGRFRDSIEDCRQALEINPYHFGAAAGMGQSHLQIGDNWAALECFRRALELNPNLEGVRANIIHLERALKDQQ